MKVTTLEELESAIADMQKAIDGLRDQIWDLQDEKHKLEQKQAFFRGEASKLRAIWRETTAVEKWQQWLSDASLHGHRWSPSWWASTGWAKLAQHTIGDGWREGNLCWLIAAFAELDEVDQFVLECDYGIGVPKLTLAEMAKRIPYKDFTKVGISHERARQRVVQAIHRLHCKWYEVCAMEVSDDDDAV